MKPGRPSDAALGAVLQHLVTRLAAAAIEDLRARYDLGRVMHVVRYAPQRGPGPPALKDVSVRLRVHPSALRRWARVSEAIREAEFDALCALRDPCGMPLTWSHLELLAEVRSPQLRRELALRASAGGLSVRQLRVMVRRDARGT